MSHKLRRRFFVESATEVAKEMLGKYIIHLDNGVKLSGRIVETESYMGPEDKAAHSYKWKKTERNRVEYLTGGHIYIYLVYGMYWQLNITTAKEGLPQCVLIRAVEPVEGIKEMTKRRKMKPVGSKISNGSSLILNLTSGPGKLCQALGFDSSHYGLDVTRSPRVWLEDRGEKIPKKDIFRTKRVGIDYAEEWADKHWRFYLKSNPFVSKK